MNSIEHLLQTLPLIEYNGVLIVAPSAQWSVTCSLKYLTAHSMVRRLTLNTHISMPYCPTYGMVGMGHQLVITKAIRPKDLMQMCQGEIRLRQRARMSMYWLNMDAEINNAAKSCESCTKRLPSHRPEPMRQHQPAADSSLSQQRF